MEAGNSSAGNRNKHNAPNRSSLRMHIMEIRPDLRNDKLRFCKNADGNANCHNNKADAEYRINFTDNLIN